MNVIFCKRCASTRVKFFEKMDGVAEILVPGERAWRERTQRMETGIELDDDFVEQLGLKFT